MKAIPVIDSSHLVALSNGEAILVGAPPEALKVLVLWEYPFPSTVVLPPDPLFAHGINQASFEFLLFNHMFRMNGLRDRRPFIVVCDAAQRERVELLAHQTLRGPSDAEMAQFRTPAGHRRQLVREAEVVSGEVSGLPLEQMIQVRCFDGGRLELEGGVCLETPTAGELRVSDGAEALTVPRSAQTRDQLPFYFADVETPVAGPKFGLQVIGSASGFSGAEWGSCFIIWINGQPLIVDGTPYLDDHLRRLGIEDDHILGYLITHNHEDHANAIGQLINRRPITLLTSGPVMASLIARLSAILDCPKADVRKLFRWVPLHPGLEGFGEPLHWFGAEIRTWYSVHTIPTLGVDIAMDGKRVRLPGDTLWGRQLDPLLEQGVITRARYDLIQQAYEGADVIVADAGGGPIHPDPQEVRELLSRNGDCRMLTTHIPESARELLPTADPGAHVVLIPREERTPEEAMALFGSPILQNVPERWLLSLLYGGEVVTPGKDPLRPQPQGGALFVLAGSLSLQTADGAECYPLQRGDLYHPDLTPELVQPRLEATAPWTRLLRIPPALYAAFLKDTAKTRDLERLFHTRRWWRSATGEELGLDSLVALSQLCRERTFRSGSRVVSQGEPATHFYLVTEGEVEVVLEHPNPERVVGTFGPGFSFGEIALLNEEVRTATVRAVLPSRVLELPARAFRRHLMEIPVARYRISREAARRKAELRHPPAEEVRPPTLFS